MSNEFEKNPKIKKKDEAIAFQGSEIEVEFKEEVRPEILAPTSGRHQEIRSPSNIRTQ